MRDNVKELRVVVCLIVVYAAIYKPLSLASSTKMISFRSERGERLITLHTVRNSVVQASLWNTITIEVVGSFGGYCFFLQLRDGRERAKQILLVCSLFRRSGNWE